MIVDVEATRFVGAIAGTAGADHAAAEVAGPIRRLALVGALEAIALLLDVSVDLEVRRNAEAPTQIPTGEPEQPRAGFRRPLSRTS